MIGGAYYVHMSMSAPLKIKKKDTGHCVVNGVLS